MIFNKILEIKKDMTYKEFFLKILKRIFRYLEEAILFLPRALFRIAIPVNNKCIVFMTNTFNYTCNPKYISEKLIEKKIDCEIIWITDDLEKKASTFPANIKLLKKGTLRCFYAVSSAKIWIDNGVAFSNYYEKKKTQTHIQTMHGSLGIKRLDNAVLTRNRSGYFGKRIVRRESNNTDLVITNSLFEENVFKSVFWKNTPMKRLGHARTDILFVDNKEIQNILREKVSKFLGIPKDKKYVLYGPTYRNNATYETFNIDFVKLVEELKNKFNEEYVILFRFHNRNMHLAEKIMQEECVYNASDYPDIQELMLISDIAITDYSSWIYDYVNTYKPGFIFATDVEKYNSITGFYYLLEETPFPVCHNNDELIKSVHEFNILEYKEKVKAFLKDKEAVDDGHSAERIVKEIESILA